MTATTNQSGGLVNTYWYDPWGMSIGSSRARYNAMQYTGTYLDSATELYQMGARYYGAAMGRFTQADSLGKSIFTANRYAYAGCNPTNYADPVGLMSFSCLTSAAQLRFGLLHLASVAGGAPRRRVLGQERALSMVRACPVPARQKVPTATHHPT